MSQELEPVDDHAEDALTLLPEQFKRKENFEAFVTAFVNVVQDTEDMLQALWQGRFLDNAIGSQLDGLGSIVGEERGSLEDDDYRVRIRVRIRANFSSGLASDIIDVFALLLESTTPAVEIIEYFPAGLVVSLGEYTTIDPNTMAELLRDVRATAVNTQLVYLSADPSNSFQFASGDASEIDEDRGFALFAPTTFSPNVTTGVAHSRRSAWRISLCICLVSFRPVTKSGLDASERD